MNRKSKIIVSVVGIAIVLLALLGITYAYYLTRIQGNTNTNSISVTTADLKLVYGDGNGLVTASDIMPGTTITKTFTVTNAGDSRVEGYVVVLEEIVNQLSRTGDLTYTLSCKLENETSCGETSLTDGKGPEFPSGITEKAIFLNAIDKDVTHYYTLTVTYENDLDEDQSEDMGKIFSALVNIKDPKEIDTTGLSLPKTLLADSIINNYGGASTITEITDYSAVTTGLYKTEDNYETSYYYRGDIQNNYVSFADMCFRIVRIEGDGSIKLVYAGPSSCSDVGSDTGVLYDENDEVIYARYGDNGNGNYADYLGYEYDPNYDYFYAGRGLREELELWYTTNIKNKNYEGYLKNDLWCLEGNQEYLYDLDGNIFLADDGSGGGDNSGSLNYGSGDFGNGNYGYLFFTSGYRLLVEKKTSLKCDNETTFESFYGILLADEIVLAGGKFGEENHNYYLYENVQTETYSTFSVIKNYDGGEGDGLAFVARGALNEDGIVYAGYAIRPSITLKVDTKVLPSGNGTKTNPYAIN